MHNKPKRTFITNDYDPYYAKEVAEKWVLMGGVVIYVDNK